MKISININLQQQSILMLFLNRFNPGLDFFLCLSVLISEPLSQYLMTEDRCGTPLKNKLAKLSTVYSLGSECYVKLVVHAKL